LKASWYLVLECYSPLVKEDRVDKECVKCVKSACACAFLLFSERPGRKEKEGSVRARYSRGREKEKEERRKRERER
jgi:hypothetical protein